jgi:hypothetical protein
MQEAIPVSACLSFGYDVASEMRFIPSCAAVVLFILLWRADMLSRPYIIGGFVLIGVAGQILAPAYSTLWFLAALLNVGLALYMAILLKLD